LWISFGVLLVTALAQAVLVAFTGSVAMLGGTLHNLADALTGWQAVDRLAHPRDMTNVA
jgi:divalent metal cation (Fe/Co/Zn/Cd) transporter